MCLVANAQNSLAPNGVGTPAILTFSLKFINTGDLSAYIENDVFKLFGSHSISTSKNYQKNLFR